MTKIGYEQVKPAGTPQGKIPPAIDSSLQGAPGSQPSGEPLKEDTHPNGQSSTAPAPPQPEGTSQPSSTTSATPDHKADLIGYDNQISILKKAREGYAQANETEEERRKRERREKSKRVIAAVGDGIRALSNLYFTSQYAPNMYNPDDSQLAKTDARQEKLRAEREANRDKYLSYSLRIGGLENDRARTVREMEAQAERIRLAREKDKREAQEHQWLAGRQTDINREQTAKADAAESISTIKAEEAKNAPEKYREEVGLIQDKRNTEKAKQGVALATVNEKKAGAALKRSGIAVNNARVGALNRSNVSEFSAYDGRGREHKFRTKAAADDFAKRHGTYKAQITATTKDRKTKTDTKTTSGGYSQNPKESNFGSLMSKWASKSQ